MKHTSFLSVVILMVVIMFPPGFRVSAQENGTEVDFGNALNTFESARETDPTDSDGDGYGEAAIREGGRYVEAGNVAETQQQGDDGDADGLSDEARTSNGGLIPTFPSEPRSGAQVSDVDSDATIDEYVKKSTRTIRWSVEEGAASIVSGGGLSEEASIEFLNKLDRIKTDVVISEKTNEWSLENISISAQNLEDWTDIDREFYQALRQTLEEDSPEYASLQVVEHVLNDNRIESIISDDASLKMEYRARIKLFGLIPIEDNVTATLQLPGVDDVVWDIKVAVDWPWYARFLSTKESARTINETVQTVAKVAKFKAGKALAETVK